MPRVSSYSSKLVVWSYAASVVLSFSHHRIWERAHVYDFTWPLSHSLNTPHNMLAYVYLPHLSWWIAFYTYPVSVLYVDATWCMEGAYQVYGFPVHGGVVSL